MRLYKLVSLTQRTTASGSWRSCRCPNYSQWLTELFHYGNVTTGSVAASCCSEVLSRCSQPGTLHIPFKSANYSWSHDTAEWTGNKLVQRNEETIDFSLLLWQLKVRCIFICSLKADRDRERSPSLAGSSRFWHSQYMTTHTYSQSSSFIFRHIQTDHSRTYRWALSHTSRPQRPTYILALLCEAGVEGSVPVGLLQ